jgi:hypothetical protein
MYLPKVKFLLLWGNETRIFFLPEVLHNKQENFFLLPSSFFLH